MIIKTLLVLAASGAVLYGCGGVPGNAVATVDGESINKSDFTHWQSVIGKSAGAKPDKKAIHDQALQLLISFRWIQGEAAKQGIKVTDADVQKSFADQKKQSFPAEADYKKFLSTSGQTEQDILQRVKLDLLSNKIRDKVTKGKDVVSDAAIADFYTKNKAQMQQPEKRDLRVVVTKDKDSAQKAYDALKSGDSWDKVAKQYSIDATSKDSGGKVPAQAKGSLDPDLDAAVFGAEKNQVEGPIKTANGYYDFAVTGITAPTQLTLADASPQIKQTLVSQNQQKALDGFVKDFTSRWRAKTECSEGYKTSDCANGPKPTPTPATTPGAVPTQ